jgi:hypothetical protein
LHLGWSHRCHPAFRCSTFVFAALIVVSSARDIHLIYAFSSC